MEYEPLLKEELLDIYAEKPNFGKLKNKTHWASITNPTCNDTITVEIEVKNNKINDAKFSGTGCVINTIAASMLLEEIKGKTIQEVKKMQLHDLEKTLGLKLTPTRIKCALLPLEAVKQCLNK